MSQLGQSFREIAFGTPGGAKAASIQTPGNEAVVFGHQGAPTSGRFSGAASKRYLEAYAGRTDAIDWIMSALNLIGETAANAEWYVETEEGKRMASQRSEAKRYERVAPQDLVNLLERPNPWMDWGEMVELFVIDYKLTGDSFWYLFGRDDAGKPLAIYRLSPALVEVVPGETTMIEAYKYAVPGMQTVEFPAEDIVHIKHPNPHDPYRGAGIVAGGARVLDMELALTRTKAAFFEQGAKLSGVLETDRSMNDGVIAKIRKQFMGFYGGADNAYKVAVLERGLKFTPVQANAVDAAFGEMSDQSRDRIMAMLRVPISLFGLGTAEARTGDLEADRRTFSNSTIRPLLDKLERAVSRDIVEAGWGLKFGIEYEYQMPIEQQVELATNFATVPGVTVGEVRAFLKLDPLEGEYEKTNDIVLNLPGDNENASDVKDRGLGKESGRPPNGENTAAFPKDGETAPPDATVEQ